MSEKLPPISDLRRAYGEAGLGDLPLNPMTKFRTWMQDAAGNPYVVEPNAMVLSTTDEEGQVWSRSVLLKGIDEQMGSFTFFTNYGSNKARHIGLDSRVTLLFPWYPLERQVIVTGVSSRVSDAESDEYFASRPRGSQIGAWASNQSEPLNEPADLQQRFEDFSQKFANDPIPRPPHWGGFVVSAKTIEFWQGRYSRLHDRARYVRQETWTWSRLQP